jgi:hypothetical protein
LLQERHVRPRSLEPLAVLLGASSRGLRGPALDAFGRQGTLDPLAGLAFPAEGRLGPLEASLEFFRV